MSEEDFSISPDVFVQEFKELKDSLVEEYFSSESDISRIKRLEKAGFTPFQISVAKSIVDEALTDALYTILLGLDGCASISQHQITYKLFDEASNEITGEIESIAWEKFHGENT
ncbi:hypothetical protein GCM10008090_23180 [Arenicella chitinivorans]|uniref:Uncharacterized protein n=1 Tax=Arenicella chitinivorans TaxID=1329800 RepID=A0A918VPT1_9GAMM|nr:hypothetical protein [Arenicella chitinivorans]GHA12864.1 hypothetical protein GCM10008090_23180 [Arenicella chitinivorans]